MVSRELARAARLFADQQSGRLADLPTMRGVIGTLTAVAGGDVTVSWRGSELAASAVAASYTPTVGDRVICLLTDNQLVVLDRLP